MFRLKIQLNLLCSEYNIAIVVTNNLDDVNILVFNCH